MRLIPAIALLVLSAPELAFACGNTIARQFLTYPLDFAHLGVVAAGLILLRWPKSGAKWDPELLLGPDELMCDEDRVVPPISNEPSMVRQFTILAVCVTAGVGFGFFNAKLVGFEFTKLLTWAAFNSGLIAAAIGLSVFTRFPSLRIALRRILLLFAALTSMIGSVQAHDGYYNEAGHGFQVADPSVVTQVTF